MKLKGNIHRNNYDTSNWVSPNFIQHLIHIFIHKLYSHTLLFTVVTNITFTLYQQ